MIKITISDRGCCRYPFEEAWYYDPQIVYHGTSTAYSKVIEASGFNPAKSPLPLKQLQKLLAIADEVEIGAPNSHGVLGVPGEQAIRGNREWEVFFSANFWFARDYATDRGGEIVRKAVEFADRFLITRAGTSPAEEQHRRRVHKIREELMTLICNAKPIVYAVQVEYDWFRDKGSELAREQVDQYFNLSVNIPCTSWDV